MGIEEKKITHLASARARMRPTRRRRQPLAVNATCGGGEGGDVTAVVVSAEVCAEEEAAVTGCDTGTR